MSRPFKLVRKFATFCHRWMGVAFCVLFAWWFVTGIFMMYWSFPRVDEADRLAHAQQLDAARVQVSPGDAYKKLGINALPDSMKLTMFDGRPAYVFEIGGGKAVVFADDGSEVEAFAPEMNLRTASAWTGQPAAAATVADLTEPDQWTVNMFHNVGPVTRYSWANGEQVYVSQGTGDVVQYTTTASRIGGYLGPVAHWLYFTPLRKNGALWSKIVVWASGMGTIMAILGLIVGIWRYSPSRRYTHRPAPSSIPYVGQKRLHMILGLFFGIIVCTWSFSGMLSMEPFPRLARSNDGGNATARIEAALRGGDLMSPAFAQMRPSEVLARADRAFPVAELEFASIAGEPVYIARNRTRVRVIPASSALAPEEHQKRITDAVRGAVAVVDVRLITEYDAYYLDREKRKPLPVLRFQLSDEGGSLYYVDPTTARLVGTYNSRAWATRWLYHGLHSINLPWLYAYRPAWDIIVLMLMFGGTALCVTSVIIAGQVVRRKLPRRAPPTAAGQR